MIMFRKYQGIRGIYEVDTYASGEWQTHAVYASSFEEAARKVRDTGWLWTQIWNVRYIRPISSVAG